MAAVKKGDTVRVHYVGRTEDGAVFDSSEDGASLEFKVGDGEFLAGLEDGVLGMSPGESKTIRMNAEQAYGEHHTERVFEYNRTRLPEDAGLSVGRQLLMYRADGQPVTVTIVGISETSVTMDCNHPLAGKNLIFDVVLEEIV